ncbi:Reverse transcriptase domain [Arabidopsis suecica]|uniref:Reverse transcriptase domain n=1 Tax=Arabidopsis suecica TaxID=45249 RepID=A0A8T1ZU50_ARASU|nr:Reverse transcriptase domain [Arabidopsis suecica]
MRNKKSSKKRSPPPAVSPSQPSASSPEIVCVPAAPAPQTPSSFCPPDVSSSTPLQSAVVPITAPNAPVSASALSKAIPVSSDLALISPDPVVSSTSANAPQEASRGKAQPLPFLPGTIHSIVNGIWSRFHRDISVTKMEGNAYLFRIPNSSTRNRVLSQGLWQIDGLTMFVAKWEPGPIPKKPELSSAPVWLELRNVPFQLFNEDGFEFIAGLVGEPKGLHPSTANLTNLEVAKVFTLIDPRKPLPEAVNVQFPTGEISRVLVSSPWMPPICSFCKEVGHSLKRCKLAPISCSVCNSACHPSDACPRAKAKVKKKTQKRSKDAAPSVSVSAPPAAQNASLPSALCNAKAEPSSKGKEKAVDVAIASPSCSLPDATIPKTLTASSSEWIQVKPRSSQKKALGAVLPGSSAVQESFCIDIGLEQIQVETKELEETSLSSDSSDVHSGEEGVDPEIDETHFLKMFSQRQQRILGKIWIMWHPSVKVSIISKSLQMMTCDVILTNSQSEIVISFVYAANEESARRELWNEIVNVSCLQRVRGKPWTVLGDFNQVLYPNDHSFSLNPNVDLPTRLFRDCLLDAELSDLTYRGCTFTWWNKRTVNPVAKKIDRILVNEQWLLSFPRSFGYFGEPDFSDHASCCITLRLPSQRSRKAFRFQNFLLQNSEFVPLISHQWFSFNFVGSAMYRLSKKLKALKSVIREFSRDNYSDLEKRVKEAHSTVLVLQHQLLSNPTDANALLERSANEKWQILLKAEESFLYQRSRVTWLREGDLNTAYFHRITAARQAINHIHFLVDFAGNIFDSQQAIQEHCVDYFSNLLGGSEEAPQFDQADLSTGLDGYSVEFFRSCWHVVGPELVEAVAEFFRTGQILNKWNATTLILIPKIPNASSTSEFRPISLCNTVYKVISKLLAGRLQTLLPCFISNSQSAFLPGRLLAENVLLASELVNGYGRKNIGPSGMLKVDLRKAFDSVKWEFILAILRALHFPDRFTAWISQCISTPQFSVSVNGQTSGYFKSSRGLRQGDPISPYLFVLAMEVFSRLMRSSFAAGFINHHPKTKELDISHLMFADDVMVFFDGSMFSLQGIADTMDTFASWSGLRMNCDKTQLFTAGLSPLESTELASSGFSIGSLPIRYLGLPLMCRKLRISEFSPLIDKMTKKFNAWAVSSLSFAGRLLLIKSVIYGLFNFWASTFILPKACIKKMESLCARFLWSGSIERVSGAKVAWAAVCYPKSEGGLGLRRMGIWNSTLCLKLIWLLFSGSGSLWVAWHKHHHLRGKSFWSVKEKATDSWNWRSLIQQRHLAMPFVKCTIGNGETASFWFDNWCPLGPLITFVGENGPMEFQIHTQASVADACDDTGWKIPPLILSQSSTLASHLSHISLPLNETDSDYYSWVVLNKKFQSFPTSKTWDIIRPRDSLKEWVSSVWFKGATPKHAFTMWVSQLDRLPTRARLASWGLPVPETCCLCSASDETRDHLLLRCRYSEQVWQLIQLRLRLNPCVFYTWSSLLAWTKLKTASSPPILRKLAAHATVYHIWKQRNNILHNQVSVSPAILFREIDRELRNTISARRHRKQFRDLMVLWIR